MNYELVEGVATISLDLVGTLALSVLLLLLGYAIRKKVNVLDRLCIPAPVIGGLLFSLIAFAFRQAGIINFEMDTILQSPLMIAFFTTVGLGGSFALLKTGGSVIIVYWILSSVLTIGQNVVGVLMAKVTGVDPMFGIMAGAVSMAGGHGSAVAFGETAVEMGFAGADTAAVAAATFGLIAGGLIGGPISRAIIERNNLQPTKEEYGSVEDVTGVRSTEVEYDDVMHNLAILLVVMVVGSIFSNLLTRFFDSRGIELSLPGYVGAMFVAVIFRNLNDKFKMIDINFHVMDLFGDVSLGIFLSMALMTLKFWELAGLAGPLLIIVIAQVIFIGLYSGVLAFNLLGKDYDAAVMSAGMLGHGLGATPNAMANMSSVTQRYGPSSKAFLIVPLVGAFLVDVIHIPNIIIFMNIFK